MSSPGEAAHHACSYCKRQKRKCDKLTPSCTTCRRARRICEYVDDRRTEAHNLRSRLDYLERLLANQSTSSVYSTPSNTSDVDQYSFRSPPATLGFDSALFPSAWFLDIDCFQKMNVALPRPLMPASGTMMGELGPPEMWRNIINLHVNTTHIWLPIVWRRKIDTLIANQTARLPCGTALLLASMKLVAHVPDQAQHASHNRLYVVLKEELAVLENQGYISLGLLQAAIFLAVYEMGHSIYPAAYLSVGRCVNIAHVMGLHSRKSAPQAIARPTFWSETEELTRVWCAILVLDRYINLGSPERPLASGDFTDDEILPCDTSSWDRGEPSASIPLFLTSATTVKTDAFARTCQVAHLIGHTFRHRDDKALVGPFRFTSAKQLLGTMDSLLGLLASECDTNPAAFGSPYAMALGCKMILLDIYVCTDTNGRINCAEETELQALALSTYPNVMRDAEWLAQRLLAVSDGELSDMRTQGPFTGHCLYQGALTAAWYLSESGAEEMKNVYDTFILALDRMSERWRVAGDYKSMVHFTEKHSRQSLETDLMSA